MDTDNNATETIDIVEEAVAAPLPESDEVMTDEEKMEEGHDNLTDRRPANSTHDSSDDTSDTVARLEETLLSWEQHNISHFGLIKAKTTLVFIYLV